MRSYPSCRIVRRGHVCVAVCACGVERVSRDDEDDDDDAVCCCPGGVREYTGPRSISCQLIEETAPVLWPVYLEIESVLDGGWTTTLVIPFRFCDGDGSHSRSGSLRIPVPGSLGR